MYVRCERRPGPWRSHTSQVPVCLFTGTAAAQVCFVVILVTLFLCIQAVHKKNLFPVQRVAQIEASWAAAISFFPHFFFFFHENIVHFWKKKEIVCKTKKKKARVAPFLATRPVYRKQNYFYGQPQYQDRDLCSKQSSSYFRIDTHDFFWGVGWYFFVHFPLCYDVLF